MAALVVANNYTSLPSIALHGCFRDGDKMALCLTRHQHVPRSSLRKLHDATVPQFQQAVADLVAHAAQDKTCWFHYSGHGTQTPNDDGTEQDGQDEDIVMCGARSYELVKDDWLLQNLVVPFARQKARLVMVFDCCHSGTVCDMDRLPAELRSDPPTVFCWSACQDSEVATETAGTNGVFTDALCRVLLNRPLEQSLQTLEQARAAVESEVARWHQNVSVCHNGLGASLDAPLTIMAKQG